MTIPFTSIIEGDRARDSKKYGDIAALAESIRSVGLIQPIILSKEGESYHLIAGGRRFAAMRSLNVIELHHGTTLDPKRLGFVFENEVPLDVRREAELDENLHRLDMDWIDNCLLIADVHRAKKDRFPKWGFRQTATLLGKGYGLATVNIAVRISKFLRAGDEEFLKASTLSEAIAIAIKRKEDAALAEMQKRVPLPVLGNQGKAPGLDTINFNIALGGPVSKEATSILTGGAVDLTQTLAILSMTPESGPIEPMLSIPPVDIPFSVMFRLGDSVKDVMPTLPDSCVDHIITDIPYGIDMDNLTTKGLADVSAEHEVQANVDQMEGFLQQAYRLVRSGGFCVFFYDLDHHEKLQAWATSVGFKVQRWPLIWHKTHSCHNNAPQYNFTKSFEVAMILRKDEKTVLRKPQTSCIWMGDGAAERRLYNNPFAKPFELWKFIYDAVAFQGQSVLDPFCGEMSACRAAANCGLVPYGIEVNEKHFNRGLQHMQAVYGLIHKGNVRFV